MSYSKAKAAFIKHYGWRRAAILYRADFEYFSPVSYQRFLALGELGLKLRTAMFRPQLSEREKPLDLRVPVSPLTKLLVNPFTPKFKKCILVTFQRQMCMRM